MPDSEITNGDNVILSINFTKTEEQQKVFNKIGEDGKVTMPLQNTFWGARFGTLTDKFGMNWMFNYDKKDGKK